MPPIKIILAGNQDREKWDSFVIKSPNSSPYHLFAWKGGIEEAYRHKCYYLIAEEGGTVLDILPLVYFKAPLCRGQLVSLPFCDVGSFLTNNEVIQKRLLEKALSLGKELSAKSIHLRTRKIVPSIEKDQSYLKIQENKVSMLLDLPPSSPELWSSFKSKLRSQIRKAEKNGLTFSWGGLNHIDDFYDVFARNMRELGSPVHSKKWIKSIMSGYGENAKMGLVYYGPKVVGVGLILCCGSLVSIPWASTLREFNRLAPNMLLYWNFLKFASDSGYKEFDLGRSTENEGTYKFKRQWGALPSPLNWYSIPLDNAKRELNSGNAMKRTFAGIWQKIPLPVANRIGPHVRKYISL